MKILSAIVIPPHLSASGAVNAAMAMSQALRSYVTIDVAMMGTTTQRTMQNGLRVFERKGRNWLGWTKGWLPNKFRTLFYRSDIDRMVDGYDLVHIHNPIPALEMERIAKACLRRRIPYVVTTHGFVEVYDIGSAYGLGRLEALAGKWLVRRPVDRVVSRADHLCCLAPQDRQILVDHGVPLAKTSIIPNGVAPHLFEPPSEAECDMVLRKFGLPIDKPHPVCFFLANHTRNKGLDILCDAFLGSKRPYLLIVGGKKRDYDYEGIAKKTLAQQKMVFTDALSDLEIRVMHHYSDLFVFPSRADTLPLVILEAMAAGKAVLSTQVGGIPFQIDASCGVLVPPENPIAFREAMEKLLADPEQLRTLGQAGREKARNLFCWDHSAWLTYKVYCGIFGIEACVKPFENLSWQGMAIR